MNAPAISRIDIYTPDKALAVAMVHYLSGLKFHVGILDDLPKVAPSNLLIAEIDTARLAAYGEDANILQIGGQGDNALQKPLRLGTLADIAQRMARRAPVIAIGPHRLYPQARRLAQKDGPSVALTEKEVDILTYLHASASVTAPATREALLAAVWNYREGVTTHTLETHIYRLRQKLETSPETPAILLTADSGDGGYYLAD